VEFKCHFILKILVFIIYLSAGSLATAQQINIRPALKSTKSKSYVKSNTLSTNYFYSNLVTRGDASLSIEYLTKTDSLQPIFLKYSTHTGNFNIIPYPFTGYTGRDYIFGTTFLYNSVDFHQISVGKLFRIKKNDQRKNILLLGPSLIGNILNKTNSFPGHYSTSTMEIIEWSRLEENNFCISLEAIVRYVFNNKKRKEILSIEVSYQHSLSWFARQKLEYVPYLAPPPDDNTIHSAVLEYRGSALQIGISKGIKIWRN
jgi:hypothetical protein